MNTKLKLNYLNKPDENYFINVFLSNKTYKTISYFIFVMLLSNLNAIVDYFLQPQIPYFDIEHVIVGGSIFILCTIIYIIVYLYYNVLIKEHVYRKSIAERFDYFSKYANDIIIFININGEIIEINEKACTIYGYNKEQLLKMNIKELLSENNRENFNNIINKIKTEGGLIHESEHLKSDGTTFFVEVSSRNINIDNKSYFQCIIRDITERKQMETELIESEEKYRGFLENSNDLIWSLDKNGCFIWANKKASEVSGYSLDEVFGKSFEPLIYKDDFNIAFKAFNNVLKGNNTCYEVRAIKKNGEEFNLLINSGPFKRHGEIIGSIAFAKDITQYKNAQKELELVNNNLKISEGRFRSLTESSSAGIFLHNGENFEIVNSTVLEGTGFTKEEMYNMKFFEIIHPDDRQMVIDFWARRSKGEDIPNKYECKLITKDGHLLWAEISAKLIELNNKKYLIGTAFNITERKNAEELLKNANYELIKSKERAEESDKLKTAFINNISHEIRTPMNSIIGFAELLNDESLTSDKRKQYIEFINNSSNQLLSIISDIISISNIQAGKEKLKIKETNLNVLLDNLLNQFKLKFKNENVEIRLKKAFNNDSVNIKIDETKLIQVLSNLLTNALKFTKKGHVEFGYKVEANWLEFYVEDTGIGIEAEAHSKIFERFSQANPSISINYGGTGLGLSISNNFVELMGGKIWLKSILDEGSTFYFTIPFEQVKQLNIIEKSNNFNIIKNALKTILIAEDQDANFMLLSAMLSKSNFKIIRAYNGVEAFELCKLKPEISLIIMDIKMPVMNGLEATKLIKEFNPKIPIIAQTAYAQDEDKIAALEKGCNDFIPKPIIKNDLIALINKYI